MEKTARITESINAYKKLADEKADGGDFLAALGLYLTVYGWNKSDAGAIADVADCYADMGLLELSNRYWFTYLTVCPKDKQSIAYEELAINYFYLDNAWASGYYFQLKVQRDGFIAEEGLDEEIIKFFSAAASRREEYFIAYPFDKADYSSKNKKAKRAFAAGDIPRAIAEFEKIPAECRTEEISGDYAAALFLARRDDEAEEVCRDSLIRHGNNVSAYCNLAAIYQNCDGDKAKYYYGLALKSRKGDKAEDYKIATCAIERGDHLTAKECIKVILTERPYDDVMNFFYALACINLGEKAEGLKAMEKSLKINPSDAFYGYYYSLLTGKKGDNADDFIPFKYAKALPKSVESSYKRLINKTVSGKAAKINAETRDILRLMLYSEDVKTAKSAAFLLGAESSAKNREVMSSALIDGDISDEVKNSLIYLLIAGGEKGKINAVIGSYFASVRPRKVIFENKADGAPYMSAYALALTKAVCFGIEDHAKIAFNMNALYTGFSELIRFNGFGAETVAAICYLLCGFSRPEGAKAVCAAFGVDKTLVKSVEEFCDFVKENGRERMRRRAENFAEQSKNKSRKEKKGDKDNKS